MMPGFVPPESDEDPRARLRAKLAVVIGLVVAVLIGVGLLVLRGGTGGMPWMILTMIIGVAVVMGVIMMVQAAAQSRHKTKTKAELDDLDNADVYSRMNKFVEDINEAEAEYLQRKLRERGIIQPDDSEDANSERRKDQRG